jgi:hypothetical protein
MADPTVIECSSACTVTVEFTAPLLNLTTADALELLGPMLTVLIAGWAFRMVIRVMNTAGGSSPRDDE